MQFIKGGFKGCREQWVDGFDEPPLSPLLSSTLAGVGNWANRWRLPPIRAVREGNLTRGVFPYESIQQFQRYGFRKVWPKCCLIFGPSASPYGANGQITITLHNYRSRQVHETLNGANSSSGLRDMRSAKSGPNLWQIWQVFGPWASPYRTNGQINMTVYNYRPRHFHRISNGEKTSSGYRAMGSASLAATRPATRTVTTISLHPGGLKGKQGVQRTTTPLSP